MKLSVILLLLVSLQITASYSTVLQFQNSKTSQLNQPVRIFDQSDLRRYTNNHQKLNNYLNSYAAVYNKQVQFSIHLLHTGKAASWLRRKLSDGYTHKTAYFASKFNGASPIQVFHCMANYRYEGFRNYVKTLPGFDNFILSLDEQLKADSELHKKLAELGCLQDFSALKNMHQAKLLELAQNVQAKNQVDLCKKLQANHFNDFGIKLLTQHTVENQFLYTGNTQQRSQLEQIAGFINDVGEFKYTYYQTPELNEITDHATSFGILANHANRENLPSASQAFLEIGQNILALGRGLIAGCERNLSGVYHLIRHPIEASTAIAGLIKDIGCGIGKVAMTISKNELGQLLNDQSLIDSAKQDMHQYLDSGKQIYQYTKKTWQDKSKIERYELIGNLMSDLLLAKGLPVADRLLPIKNLAQYQPQAFAKLGHIGREINQIAGLTYTKGTKFVQNGFEVIKKYPQIIQSQQLLGEAIWDGSKYLTASNKYLKQLSQHVLKCAIDSERRLIRIGEHVKKLPKSCISKTKQILGEELLVTDTLGNIWRSKIGESGWVTEFSEQGRRRLVLLNETTAGFKEAAHEVFQHYRAVPYGIEAREVLNVMKWQSETLERELRAIGKTFKDFYGQHITGKLGDELIHFTGKAHLLTATIKRTAKASGITEKVTGLHWDFGHKLEQLGIYSLSNVEHLTGGMYRATLNYGGILKKEKTFFPSHWTAKMLASKISEACYNVEKVNFKKSEKVIEIIGKVSEGFKITIRLDKRGKILTAFPSI